MENTFKIFTCLLMLSTQLGFAQGDLVFYQDAVDEVQQREDDIKTMEDIIYHHSAFWDWNENLSKVKAYEGSEDEAYLAAEARIQEINIEANEHRKEKHIEALHNAEQDMILYMQETGQATDGSESDDWAKSYLANRHILDANKDIYQHEKETKDAISSILADLPTPEVTEEPPVEIGPTYKHENTIRLDSTPQGKPTTIWLC